VASLAGQATISLWVDHVGLMGSGKAVVTIRRVVAAVITVLAVIISAGDRFSMSNFSSLLFFSYSCLRLVRSTASVKWSD